MRARTPVLAVFLVFLDRQIVAMHSWRSTLEVLRGGPDDDLVDFHLGQLLDGVSDRAARSSRGNSHFVELAQIRDLLD